ncbi:MAG: sugar phosphate isomerase/epimerase family protein [Planctomycetota bacterium]|jgi:sugar phosphate isomerase/epimerase
MMNPEIGVCSWSLRPQGPAHLAEMLQRLGIPAVQLALVPLVEKPRVWADAGEMLTAAGIHIASGMLAMVGEDYLTLNTIRRTGGVRPDADWPVNRQRCADVARVAEQAGLGLVTFHAGFLPEQRDDPLRRTMIERLRTVADVFAEHGVEVALETGQETAETLAGVLEELERPAVGVNFDPANMILYGRGDPVTALNRLAAVVKQIHIKDAVPTDIPGTWGTEVVAGRGAVDWEAFFGVATSISPPVSFIIERESGADRLDDIAAARDLIETHVRE